MDTVVIGRIAGVFGCKGYVKVVSFTEPRDNLLRFESWLVGYETDTYEVLDAKHSGGGLIAQLKGVSDRDQAAALMDSRIAVKREWLNDLPADEYYWFELTGLRVFNQHGEDLGVVTKLIETGANDVLVIEGRQRRCMIPYIKNQVIKKIDCERRQMIVEWQREWCDEG